MVVGSAERHAPREAGGSGVKEPPHQVKDYGFTLRAWETI